MLSCKNEGVRPFSSFVEVLLRKSKSRSESSEAHQLIERMSLEVSFYKGVTVGSLLPSGVTRGTNFD